MPSLLKAGARVAVIAPAGIPDPDLLAQGRALLEHWGYQTIPGKHLHASHRYNGGTLAQRSEDLQWALTSEDVDAVWLARGGYGCVHCLAHLPAAMPKDRVLIGNSDATSLLAALHRRGHTHLIHGPMLESLATRVDEETRRGVLQLLAGCGLAPQPLIQLAGESIEVTGEVVGGNLTVLASLCGTPWTLRQSANIVMLEDVAEAAYRLDRCVMQMIAAGAFDDARAIVLGDFTRCHLPPDADYTHADIMRDLLQPLSVPLFTGARFGHGVRNLPWAYGARARIYRGVLTFEHRDARGPGSDTDLHRDFQ